MVWVMREGKLLTLVTEFNAILRNIDESHVLVSLDSVREHLVDWLSEVENLVSSGENPLNKGTLLELKIRTSSLVSDSALASSPID